MKPEKIKKISDILFVFSIIFAVGVMFKNWYDQRGLPEGVCPIENNSTWMMLAITLLVISFIVTSIIDYHIKRQDRKEKNT